MEVEFCATPQARQVHTLLRLMEGTLYQTARLSKISFERFKKGEIAILRRKSKKWHCGITTEEVKIVEITDDGEINSLRLSEEKYRDTEKSLDTEYYAQPTGEKKMKKQNNSRKYMDRLRRDNTALCVQEFKDAFNKRLRKYDDAQNGTSNNLERRRRLSQYARENGISPVMLRLLEEIRDAQP